MLLSVLRMRTIKHSNTHVYIHTPTCTISSVFTTNLCGCERPDLCEVTHFVTLRNMNQHHPSASFKTVMIYSFQRPVKTTDTSPTNTSFTQRRRGKREVIKKSMIKSWPNVNPLLHMSLHRIQVTLTDVSYRKRGLEHKRERKKESKNVELELQADG